MSLLSVPYRFSDNPSLAGDQVELPCNATVRQFKEKISQRYNLSLDRHKVRFQNQLCQLWAEDQEISKYDLGEKEILIFEKISVTYTLFDQPGDEYHIVWIPIDSTIRQFKEEVRRKINYDVLSHSFEYRSLFYGDEKRFVDFWQFQSESIVLFTMKSDGGF